jgi:prepilin-type N-terminal cleavage/methylation domain-containing protein
MRRRGFTLVELLVVIGIIAVLVGILVPALTGARKSANRIKCLSNQRQLATALISYASENKGYFPQMFSGVNVSLTWYTWYIEAESYRNPYLDQGWFGLGMLYRRKYIKDPQAFYCPDMRAAPIRIAGQNDVRLDYPEAWGPTRKRLGYLYRCFRQAVVPYITTAEAEKTATLRVGKFRGRVALAVDVPYAWPHFPKPYGVNVCWSDASASFVELTKYDFEVAENGTYRNTTGNGDLYCYFFWRALELGDFTDFSQKVNALQWASLRAQYPPL